MTAVKITVSFDKGLLERIDQAADELHLRRSRLLARAAEEFLSDHTSRKLLERFDRAYADPPTEEEKELRRRRRHQHRRTVEGSW